MNWLGASTACCRSRRSKHWPICIRVRMSLPISRAWEASPRNEALPPGLSAKGGISEMTDTMKQARRLANFGAALALLVACTALALAPASAAEDAAASDTGAVNWFGGAVYDGDPDLETTAALVEAGGGADDFSFSTALVSMLGEGTVSAEVEQLQEQYGEERVQGF